VAVRAEQNAFPRLGTRFLQRPRRPFAAQSEQLLSAVPMVELKRCDTSVITTDKTGAPRFLNEDPLDTTSRLGNCLAAAPLAAHTTALLQNVRGSPMAQAFQFDISFPR
jgi:hypothetical protein